MKKMKGRNKYLLMLLLLAAVATSLFANDTMAKYSSSFTGSGTVNVAAFAGGADTASFNVAVNDLSPGGTSTVNFAVQNYEGDKNSEVAMTYEIQVETTGNLPLSFALSSNAGDKGPYNQPVGQLAATDAEKLKYTATGGRLPVAAGDASQGMGKKRHAYELAVTWPAEAAHDWDYSNEIDMITVTVTSTQVNPEAGA